MSVTSRLNFENFCFFTFKTIAFLNALSHNVHWWLLSPCTLLIWLPSECLFWRTLLQMGQLANVSWCRFRCFRRLSSCFNLEETELCYHPVHIMVHFILTKHRTHCTASLVWSLLNVPACDSEIRACFWIHEHICRKRERRQTHERLECVTPTPTSTQNWNQFAKTKTFKLSFKATWRHLLLVAFITVKFFVFFRTVSQPFMLCQFRRLRKATWA